MLREDDALVVYELDRPQRQAGRSGWPTARHSVQELHRCQWRRITIRRILLPCHSGLAEMERELTIERSRAALEVARQLGHKGGRKGNMKNSRTG